MCAISHIALVLLNKSGLGESVKAYFAYHSVHFWLIHFQNLCDIEKLSVVAAAAPTTTARLVQNLLFLSKMYVLIFHVSFRCSLFDRFTRRLLYAAAWLFLRTSQFVLANPLFDLWCVLGSTESNYKRKLSPFCQVDYSRSRVYSIIYSNDLFIKLHRTVWKCRKNAINCNYYRYELILMHVYQARMSYYSLAFFLIWTVLRFDSQDCRIYSSLTNKLPYHFWKQLCLIRSCSVTITRARRTLALSISGCFIRTFYSINTGERIHPIKGSLYAYMIRLLD